MRKMLTERQAGFTLIELLVVVVIIGVLATIAFPRLANTRESAYFSTLQTDLRSLSKAMEVWYMNTGFNYDGVSADGSELAAEASWTPTGGVDVNIEISASGQGWSASAEHRAILDPSVRRCALFMGDGSPQQPSTAADEGVIACNQ